MKLYLKNKYFHIQDKDNKVYLELNTVSIIKVWCLCWAYMFLIFVCIGVFVGLINLIFGV